MTAGPTWTDAADVVVIGTGAAGLAAALAAHRAGRRVVVLSKSDRRGATATHYAQGGIAVVLPDNPENQDSVEAHVADTLAAGAGLCDADAVRSIVADGYRAVSELVGEGARFDEALPGQWALTREGGHSRRRIVHAGGDATGAEVQRALDQAAATLDVRTGHVALRVLHDGTPGLGAVTGVLAGNADGFGIISAPSVILASGGLGQLYAATTNPAGSTGDGIALALWAGVAVSDLEFIQFHPTALHHPAMPRPLISEALRGHGAILRTAEGERFVDELAPRDVVSRAIARELTRSGTDHVYLDCTGIEAFSSRFPTIAVALGAAGLDPAREWLPVAPAAHYLCGGVLTDLDGRTSLPGLLAAGEVACTGVHGANRLASNSLLEGLVFGARASEAVSSGRLERAETGVFAPAAVPLRAFGELTPAPAPVRGALRAGEARRRLQAEMSADAGVVRDAASLDAAAKVVAEIETGFGRPSSVEEAEVSNLCLIGRALLEAAAVRRESRGAHTRADFPERSETYRARLVFGGQQSDG